MEIGDVLVEIELTSLMERLVVDVPEVEDMLEEKSQRGCDFNYLTNYINNWSKKHSISMKSLKRL